MPLPDFYQFAPFNILRKRMNAELGTFNLPIYNFPRTTETERQELEKGTLIIESLDKISELEDGTLAYKDKRVLLHIRDITKDEQETYGLVKFHIAWCKTLEDMHKNNRFHRYVASTRTDGIFTVRIINGDSVESKKVLDVCKNCLKHLRFNGYENHKLDKHIFDEFTLDDFFTQYPLSPLNSKPKPCDTDKTAPTNTYPPNFSDISRKIREKNNFICEKCRIDLSDKSLQNFLHTHHKDGKKYVNSADNLEVLCIECHASTYNHEHMKQMPRYIEFMKWKEKRNIERNIPNKKSVVTALPNNHR